MKTKKTVNNRQNNKKKNDRIIITPKRQPFVYQQRARGKSYQGITEDFTDEFKAKISPSGIRDFLNSHKEEYGVFREAYMEKVREPRLGNVRARIEVLEGLIEKLEKKLLKDFDTLTPNEHNEVGTLSTIRQIQSLLDQISQETGDKVQKFKGEGFGDHKHFYFGDHAINRFADLTLEERQGQEKINLRNRIKES